MITDKRIRGIVPLNRGFREANRTRRRYRVLMGSAGSGKSVNVALDFVAKLSDPAFRGANLLVVRKLESANRDSTLAELIAAIRRIFGERHRDFWEINPSVPELRCRITGNRVLFRGMKDMGQREKLKSVSVPEGKIVWAWVEEATELTSEDFDILDDRLRGILPKELYYQITLTFNPVSANHWIKRRFFDTPSEDVFTHRSTYLDNRFIDGEYHRRMLRRQAEDPEGYRIYGLGEWGECEGLILKRFSVSELSLSPDDYDSVCLAQDFGYNHANCILYLGFRDGNVYVLDELYLRLRDTEEILALAEEKHFPRRAVMWCDSAEPDRIKRWQRAGYNARGVKKESGSIRAQIDYLIGHRLTVSPRCPNLIRELQGWKWEKDPISGEFTDVPAEGDDDAIAALRYGTEGVRKRRMSGISKGALGL
ncbi:MAG: PBSX family phage terminase large subunit [Clostridia bacterium]|nr:PBSX family phage terminase large subunit [Clostridia bacterium]